MTPSSTSASCCHNPTHEIPSQQHVCMQGPVGLTGWHEGTRGWVVYRVRASLICSPPSRNSKLSTKLKGHCGNDTRSLWHGGSTLSRATSEAEKNGDSVAGIGASPKRRRHTLRHTRARLFISEGVHFFWGVGRRPSFWPQETAEFQPPTRILDQAALFPALLLDC